MFFCNKVMYPSTASATGKRMAKSVTKEQVLNDAPKYIQSRLSFGHSDCHDKYAIAARKLGVSHPKELHLELVTVDRLKLAQMIQAESIVDDMNAAEYFFKSIETATETSIDWPRRLKIDDKPFNKSHVEIIGKISEVKRAKEHILKNLETLNIPGTRVIIKMDVSYKDHSHIIGRGGENIKSIMESTASYIHFPSSNRSIPKESFNKVSLCASLENVERARVLVRNSTPLIFTFEFPIYAPGSERPQMDHDTSYMSLVERQFNVEVISTIRLHSVLILVKGSEKEATQVQAATHMLIHFMSAHIANQILVVSMRVGISAHHHEIVKGKHNTNLRKIMKLTKTKINFPDLLDINVSSLKRFEVTIKGAIDGVCTARQQLLGNVPIVLMFDHLGIRFDNASEVISLGTKYGVLISLQHKKNQRNIPVVAIEGAEKFIGKIYEACHEILQLNTAFVKAETPERHYALQNKDKDGRLSCEVSTPIGTIIPDDSTSTPTTHYDLKHNRSFEFDMTCASWDFKALERSSFSGDLGAPNDNWMAMALRGISPETIVTVNDMSWQGGDGTLNMPTTSSLNASSRPRFSGSAAPGAERRPSIEILSYS